MASLSGRHIQLLSGGGGEPFAHFMDELLHAEAACGGLAPSEVDCQIRVNIADGGVDARVRSAVPDDRSGWLGVPTCWQYKSVETADLTEAGVREEIKKSEVARLIKKGHAFRLAVRGDITPEKIADLEQKLLDEAQKIDPQAEPPRIIAQAAIATWANRFLGLRFRLLGLPIIALDLRQWETRATALTPQYEPVPDWANVAQSILQHVDLSRDPARPCLSVQGSAGVGKTRLVYEVLSGASHLHGLVVYAESESEALNLARAAATADSDAMILVADECSLETRMLMNEALQGARSCVRVICIDNTGHRFADEAGEIWLEQIDSTVLLKVLERNFPQVPGERRFQYADLAGGFIRIAADLCLNDNALSATGNPASVARDVQSYLDWRIPDREMRKVLEAISLFSKIGWKGDVGGELEALASVTGITVADFRESVSVLKDAPGFVVVAGRYWYVTPRLIAHYCFARACERWVVHAPAEFLEKIGPALATNFLARARELGSEEVRRTLADYFRDWVSRLAPADLLDTDAIRTLAALVEMSPGDLLPRLRGLIENASEAELLGLKGDWVHEGWGGRRTIVWLVERLASFPEYFSDAQAILLRLAINETEPNIGNNATATWTALFRIGWSGSAASFPDRLDVLRTHLQSDDDSVFQLALQALGEVFEGRALKTIGPALIGGRVRPASWRPADASEGRACWDGAVRLLFECAELPGARGEAATGLVIKLSRRLLEHGALPELRTFFEANPATRAELLNSADGFIEWEDRRTGETSEDWQQYVGEVRQWREQQEPKDYSGRLRTLLTRSPWESKVVDAEGRASEELRLLARESIDDAELLRAELPWLASDAARGAGAFGYVLGVEDESASLFPYLWESALETGSADLVREYVRARAAKHSDPPEGLLVGFDDLQAKHPFLAFELIRVAGHWLDGVSRTVALVRDSGIPPTALSALAYGLGPRYVEPAEASEILEFLGREASKGDAQAAGAALEFAAAAMEGPASERLSPVLELPAVREAVASALLAANAPTQDGEAWRWAKVLAGYARLAPRQAAEIACRAMGERSLYLDRQATQVLSSLAEDDAQLVMNVFGDWLLDPERSISAKVRTYRGVVQALPSDVVVAWIGDDVERARVIARHLPPPFLSKEGKPVVPDVLAHVLTAFESDDQTFGNFLAGVHGGGEGSFGNAEKRLLAEAEAARPFLTHQLRRVQEWADHEIRERQALARLSSEFHDEAGLE